MAFTIEFTPFQADNNAQLSTTAIVRQGTEILWTEPVVLAITGATTIEQLQEMLQQKTSGFAARVDAINVVRQFVGTVPQI